MMVETMYFGEKYIYQCPKCHFLASAGGDANQVHQCPKCNSIMINTNITKDEWDAKTKEERSALVRKNQKEISEKFSNGNNSILITEINTINNNIKTMNSTLITIKNILMFYFIITLLGIFFMILSVVH